MLDRLIRGSVDRAMRMQPRRTRTVVDEYLYAAPEWREQVAAIAAAGRRLVAAGLCPPTAGSIAVRRSPTKAAVTALAADLGSIDNRHLETVALEDKVSPVLSALRAGADAGIWAFPPALMALAATGRTPLALSVELAAVSGEVVMAAGLAEVRGGLTLVAGHGVVCGHESVGSAVARLEAAEALAVMTVHHLALGRSDG